jgi:ferritin-like metal-binding protein YciE
MTITSLKDLMGEQLKDLYSAESQLRNAYEQWSDAVTSDDLKDILQEHISRSEKHSEVITQICDDLGLEPTGEKCHGMEGLIQEGHEFLEDAEGDAVRDAGLIAMSQRIEHYGVAGYGCARTYALQLDQDDAAEKLQQIIEEEARVDERMSDLAERVLNPEAVAA